MKHMFSAKTKEELHDLIAECELCGDKLFADAYRNQLVIKKHAGDDFHHKSKVDKK